MNRELIDWVRLNGGTSKEFSSEVTTTRVRDMTTLNVGDYEVRGMIIKEPLPRGQKVNWTLHNLQ